MVGKEGKTNLVVGFLFAIILVFSLYFVFAAHTITTSSGGSFFSVNQSSNTIFNISINNTNAGFGANITQVNITLPSGFTFVATTNGTSEGFNASLISRAGNSSFENTTSVLTWTNSTYFVINGSEWRYFWFNATATSTPGSYNFTVNVTNSTNTYSYNISVTVNDTVAPSLSFITPTPTEGSFNISVGIPINISASDNANISTVRIYVYNSSGLINNTNYTFSSQYFINVTGLAPGQYTLNATANDTSGNIATLSSRTVAFSSSYFVFNGTVSNINATALENAVVNISVYIMGGNGPTLVGNANAASDSSGAFSLNVPSSSSWMYKPIITYTNSSTGAIDGIGQSLPQFPYAEFSRVHDVSFYLKEAGTINITAVNATGSSKAFQYQIKDTSLGYPIAESWSYVSQVTVYLSRDRNYSIMIYPNQSLPVSFNWNNFSTTISYNVSSTNRSTYNVTTHKLNKEFNCTETLVRVNGSIFNSTGQNLAGGWNEFTIIPFIIEPGNMVYLGDNAAMPYNMSAWNATPYSDQYSLALGNFSITIPAPVETTTYMLFATARNGTNYYGGYRNVSLTYGSASSQVNFTMYPLMSTDWNSSTSNFTLNKANDWNQINISSARKGFNLVNASSNATLSQTQAHIEVKLDYTNYNATQFTFMLDTSQTGTASFYLPLINETGVKEINVFSQSFAPKTVSTRSVSQIIANSNISMASFSPGDIDGRDIASSLYVSLYISNSTCDVPNPGPSCTVGSSANMENFNPLSSIIGGGKLSFRMGLTSSGIVVHYVNVDMLASGPPDALFDDSATTSTSGSFESALRFGSSGPTIYDYILVSMPYTAGSTSETGLNEDAPINMSIPLLYDENWNLIWNTTANGANGTLLAGNYSHYNTYSSQWQTLMGNNTCVTDTSTFNSTNPCYVNTTSNRIWIRLPHFSGTKPSVTGSVVTATASSSSSSSSGGWISVGGATYTLSQNEFDRGYSRNMAVKDKLKFNVSKESHIFELTSLTLTSATIKIASDPQTATLNVGETKKFDLNGDDVYDVSVVLNKIVSANGNASRANITLKADSSAVIASESGSPITGGVVNEQGSTGTGNVVNEENKAKGKSPILVLVIIVILVSIFILVFILYNKNKKKRRYMQFGF